MADFDMPEDGEEYISPDGPCWKVVGGGDKGGIVVRAGEDTSSAALARLATGAIVETVQLKGERLHYHCLQGEGPEDGWVSIKLKDKALLELCERPKMSVAHA
mmetsp:Transcript_27873/g.59007  ORF Transcript_27873/g.59007 Transcript_27873/m.59007 type:complete len:103 (+) Transcript_27873:84-392(+)